ncbi:hypothetical protein [Crocinitomix algicola]|uniref:hypothetical protein n=1 Tax=Crocinitomix algicola TaxID=1740263 RepID=UPI000872B48D|nr:hypothetical protein [Crocinitomix algicola]
MSETKELLEELDGRIVRMLSEVKVLKANLNEKERVIGTLEAKIAEQQQSINGLEQERDELLERTSGENQEALKFKIGEMVKEIDRCISLLKV